MAGGVPSNAPPPPMETRGMRKEMRGPSMDPHLFNGTPLATNHPNQVNAMPNAPGPMNFSNGPMNMSQADIRRFYDQNPIDDDDRFSIASSSESGSYTSSESSDYRRPQVTKKKITKKGKNGGGFELNIS